MQHVCDIEIAISTAQQDAVTYEAWMQVWYDTDNDCYIVIRDDVIDNRKHDGAWRLVYEVDKHGTENFN